MINHIGLDQKQTDLLIDKLQDLLASYSIFYQNVRGYHWNIKGAKFFELHVKFEELYDDLKIKVDEVAERIVTLGGTPKHSYADYMKSSFVKEADIVHDGFQAAEEILESLKTLIVHQRELLNLSDEAGDEGTNAMMSDYITEQEKTVWMYTAFLGK